MNMGIEERIRNELAPGERLLWSGRPRGGIQLDRSDAALIPLSLVVGGFALIAVAATATPDFSVRSVPATLVIVVLALYMLVGRFLIDARSRSTTAYGLTDRRALIIGGLFGSERGSFVVGGLFRQQVVSLPLQDMTNVVLRERGDRSGTISFADFSRQYADDATCTPAFAMIEGARQVYSLIQDAKAAQEESRP